MIHTRIEPVSSEQRGNGIHLAAEYLHAGELVAFPTETVYGLGADARREDAVRKIYEAKGRPSGNPVIVHVADIPAARDCAKDWHHTAEKLAKRFWPGPLTIILPRGRAITPLVSAGRTTVALRCPKHPVAEALLKAFGGPIAAPSANRSGFTSPTTAAHVLAELNGRVPLILDGGPSEIGLESTVVDLSRDVPTVLRPGAITLEMLADLIGDVRLSLATLRTDDSAASPGQHSRHYAPRTSAYRFSRDDWNAVRSWAERHARIALLTWTDAVALAAPHETIRLPEDELAYAHELYGALRTADERGAAAILILMPPRESGLWTAIADRLRRATEELPAFSTASVVAAAPERK